MRNLVYKAITENPVLTGFIPVERWLASGGVDETHPPLPFGVIKFAGDEIGVSRHAVPRLEIWIHDERGSYMRIDQILEAVREELDDHSFRWPEGVIALLDWQSYSPDLIDDGYNTNTRMAAFFVVGRSTTNG
jgi:hypothetical protein